MKIPQYWSKQDLDVCYPLNWKGRDKRKNGLLSLQKSVCRRVLACVPSWGSQWTPQVLLFLWGWFSILTAITPAFLKPRQPRHRPNSAVHPQSSALPACPQKPSPAPFYLWVAFPGSEFPVLPALLPQPLSSLACCSLCMNQAGHSSSQICSSIIILSRCCSRPEPRATAFSAKPPPSRNPEWACFLCTSAAQWCLIDICFTLVWSQVS